ncbi:hypothetical protein A2U01_0060526, partial [Trifolium medium]|nr:hypothetical protein [Trifolium medium]
MEHLEESHATLRVDVDGIKDQMENIFNMVQTMVNNPQPTMNPGVSNGPDGNTSPCHVTEGVQLVQSVP